MESAVLFWTDEQFIVSILFFIVNTLYCITVQSPTRKQLCTFNEWYLHTGISKLMWSQNQLPQKENISFEAKHMLKLKLCLLLYYISYLRFFLFKATLKRILLPANVRKGGSLML